MSNSHSVTTRYADRDNLWENDGIELYIGLDQSNPGRTAYQKDTDFQVITAFKAAPLRVRYHGSPSWADPVGPARSHRRIWR